MEYMHPLRFVCWVTAGCPLRTWDQGQHQPLPSGQAGPGLCLEQRAAPQTSHPQLYPAPDGVVFTALARQLLPLPHSHHTTTTQLWTVLKQPTAPPEDYRITRTHLGDGNIIAVPGDPGFQRSLAEAVQKTWLALLQVAVLGHLHPSGYCWVERRHDLLWMPYQQPTTFPSCTGDTGFLLVLPMDPKSIPDGSRIYGIHHHSLHVCSPCNGLITLGLPCRDCYTHSAIAAQPI